MISCTPAGFCSWDFRLRGTAPGEVATITFQWFTEQGTIETPGACFQVVKPGLLKGEWQFERDGAVAAVGRKTSPFARRFEIEFDGQAAVLEAESAFGRAMRLTTPGGGGRIAPLHAFTRRATITVSGVPFHIQCVAFWLTALTWRRSAEANAPAS